MFCDNLAIVAHRFFSLEVRMEYTHLFESMHTGELSPALIDPDQLYHLVRDLPEFVNSIYYKHPYMLYSFARTMFELDDSHMNVIKGVLSVPLIKDIVEPLSLLIYNVNGFVMKPIYRGRLSNMSTQGCI